MFAENFSFQPPASPTLVSSGSPSTRNTSRSVSPCSAVAPLPPPQVSVSDLATQFAGQRIHQASQVCYDSCEAYANLDDNAGWEIDEPEALIDDDAFSTRRTRPFTQRPVRPYSPSQRTQRQINARLLCTSAHARDISALVARMVESNDQCCVSVPETLPSATTTAVDDEGYDSDGCSNPSSSSSPPRSNSTAQFRPKLAYRRSSDMKTTGACVSKTTRLRKDRSSVSHARKRSSEKA